MHLRVGDTHRSLRRHAGLFGPLDRRDDVTRIVQSAEDTGDVGTLRMLHLVHQFTHIGRHGIHTQCVQTAVQHVGLDTRLVKRLTERTNRLVRVLSVQQVHLLRSTTVRLYTVKTAHVNDHRRNACQLILAGYVLTATLPHVAVHQRELNFLFTHIVYIFYICLFYPLFYK